jgi:hypothetical protein
LIFHPTGPAVVSDTVSEKFYISLTLEMALLGYYFETYINFEGVFI